MAEKPRKPRLTDKVLRGLNHALSAMEAGGTDEITGYSQEQLADMLKPGSKWRAEAQKMLRTIEDVEAASAWLAGMYAHRRKP